MKCVLPNTAQVPVTRYLDSLGVQKVKLSRPTASYSFQESSIICLAIFLVLDEGQLILVVGVNAAIPRAP